jgi:hypothetical protein
LAQHVYGSLPRYRTLTYLGDGAADMIWQKLRRLLALEVQHRHSPRAYATAGATSLSGRSKCTIAAVATGRLTGWHLTVSAIASCRLSCRRGAVNIGRDWLTDRRHNQVSWQTIVLISPPPAACACRRFAKPLAAQWL